MIFYSMRKLISKAGLNSRLIILAFKAHITTSMPKNRRDPLYRFKQMDFSGDSFMLNPQELVTYAFKWSSKEVAEYIALASYRNYGQYTVDYTKTLDFFHVPVTEDTINNNRLLRLIDNQIYFYYEEDLKTRKKLWH